MSLFVVIPFHKGDQASVATLLGWINELHVGGPRHSLLLAADSQVSAPDIKALADVAKKSFETANGIQINVPPNQQGWIKGSDFMFLKVAEWVKKNIRTSYLWMEPDAIPLKRGWLDELDSAYQRTPFKFMGAIVRQTTQPDMPAAHLNGNAIYPHDAYDLFSNIQAVAMGSQAWDIAGAGQVVPATKDSPLFQSFWGTVELPPVFVKDRQTTAPQHHIDFAKFIRPEAVFFHRDKTQSLIPLLRDNLTAVEGEPQELPKAVTFTATAASIVETVKSLPEFAHLFNPPPPKNKGGRPRKPKPEETPVQS